MEEQIIEANERIDNLVQNYVKVLRKIAEFEKINKEQGEMIIKLNNRINLIENK